MSLLMLYTILVFGTLALGIYPTMWFFGCALVGPPIEETITLKKAIIWVGALTLILSMSRWILESKKERFVILVTLTIFPLFLLLNPTINLIFGTFSKGLFYFWVLNSLLVVMPVSLFYLIEFLANRNNGAPSPS